jgi:hypothetical protein
MKIFKKKISLKSNQIKLSQGKKKSNLDISNTLYSPDGATKHPSLGERQLKLYPIFVAKQSYEHKHMKKII